MRERDHGCQEDKCLDLFLWACDEKVRIDKHNRFIISDDFGENSDPKIIDLRLYFFAKSTVFFPGLSTDDGFCESDGSVYCSRVHHIVLLPKFKFTWDFVSFKITIPIKLFERFWMFCFCMNLYMAGSSSIITLDYIPSTSSSTSGSSQTLILGFLSGNWLAFTGFLAMTAVSSYYVYWMRLARDSNMSSL